MAVLTSLYYTAGFVGIEAYNWYASGSLLALNTFGSHMLLTGAQSGRSANSSQPLRQCCLAYLLTQTLNAWVITCSVALQRRHLMVWALFAPRFLFQLCFLAVVDMSMTLCAVFAVV